MTDPKHGGPAFPPMHDPQNHAYGMTMRDWFAGNAPPLPQGFCKSEAAKGLPYLAAVVIWNYAYADAMLAEREREDE